MKPTLLITGAGPNGVTGRLIKQRLRGEYTLLTPSSRELDLTDSAQVDEYFAANRIDYVIHSALSAPSRGLDNTSVGDEVERNLRMYFNLTKHSGKFQKMFYFGSGAEFDKSTPIVGATEEDFGNRIPKDKYGFEKYVMSLHAAKSDNIYEIRLFGTINPYEPYIKNVVSNLCAKAVKGLPLTLNRDCRFSFVDIDDAIDFISYGITNKLNHHVYNMVGHTLTLSDLRKEIAEMASTKSEIPPFRQEGLNNEYTGDNSRMLDEFNHITPLRDSLSKVLLRINEIRDSINPASIDARWNTAKGIGMKGG